MTGGVGVTMGELVGGGCVGCAVGGSVGGTVGRERTTGGGVVDPCVGPGVLTGCEARVGAACVGWY